MNIEITDEKLWKLMSDEEKFGLTQELQSRAKELESEVRRVKDAKAEDLRIADVIEENAKLRKVVDAARALPKKSMAIKMALRELDEEHE